MEQRTFISRNAFQSAAAELLREYLSERGAVMLSGGNTPLPIYRQITDHPFKASSEVCLFMSDERMVPFSSPDHNGAQIVPMASAVGIGNIINVETSLKIDRAAGEFHENLNSLIQSQVPFTLGLLGLGTDGHTASLFNLEDAWREDGRLAIPVRRGQGPDRVSVTEELIRRFDRVVLLAAGTDKADMVEKLGSEPLSIPAGAALRNAERVEVWYSVE